LTLSLSLCSYLAGSTLAHFVSGTFHAVLPAQVEERRLGLEQWLQALLVPAHARAARDAAARASGSFGSGGGGAGRADAAQLPDAQPVPAPIKALMWECLRLDARVTHL
jgi:hypothetical protein